MSSKELNRNTYLSKNVGNFAETIKIGDQKYVKVEDLRYGTNPHQPAAFYKPVGQVNVVGDMEILKNGKSGLSRSVLGTHLRLSNLSG